MKEKVCNKCVQDRVEKLEKILKQYDFNAIYQNKRDLNWIKKTFISGGLGYFIYCFFQNGNDFLAFVLTYVLYNYHKFSN